MAVTRRSGLQTGRSLSNPHKEFPLWVCVLSAVACVGLYVITRMMEAWDWIRKSDPSELFVMLWVVICAGLFVAGMLVAIFG